MKVLQSVRKKRKLWECFVSRRDTHFMSSRFVGDANGRRRWMGKIGT